MKILGLEKVSFVDYEGKICATIFTGGCNFRCPFCHNSSLVNQTSESIDENTVLDYLKQRTSLLDGVTISGGEPCLQPDLLDFIKKVKKIGYSIKLDTNGTFPNVVEKLAKEKLIDYVAIDIKNSFSHYQAISGVKNPQVANIQTTLKLLKKYNLPYELRTTLVGEFHTTATIQQMASELAGEKILYLQKFVDNGSCISANLSPVQKDDALNFKEILSKTIKNVSLRGY
ncbi:MAG: anaerobic ribonucleoside-triphosphate reductase activating protein [Clostridiales bacterium]|nr:anaerobic ribonucleoside-triphosphate reductase activating protein [Clostridiales bacterium]